MPFIGHKCGSVHVSPVQTMITVVHYRFCHQSTCNTRSGHAMSYMYMGIVFIYCVPHNYIHVMYIIFYQQVEINQRYDVQWGRSNDIDRALIMASGTKKEMRQWMKHGTPPSTPVTTKRKRKASPVQKVVHIFSFNYLLVCHKYDQTQPESWQRITWLIISETCLELFDQFSL